MVKMRTIYAIRHNYTGRIYIGSTGLLERRIRQHLSALRSGRHPNELMQRDYNDFGEDYSFYELEHCPKDCQKPIRREYLWMDVFQTRNQRRGYNYKDWTKPLDITTLPKFELPTPQNPGRHKAV